MQHTPGPWEVQVTGAVARRRAADRWQEICTVEGADRDYGTPEGKANARLIAAAPDMIVALLEAERALMSPSIDEFSLVVVRAAITKALGDSELEA